ncbi:hypothetical protein SCHPADRAFT_906970 [Schizopora paradoxa]|uniref:Uncharacterized protein n=1 Tax=Schizopora paradoxa TaxID=27342 RepID=A0A0H2RES1_9AGAM|nr:hypothetical protein SCHPADRAFT_906970 [Schizopora paradoxa]
MSVAQAPLLENLDRDHHDQKSKDSLLTARVNGQVVKDKDGPIDNETTFALIRHIVQPPLQWPLIPHLLRLLVQVERTRQHCVLEVEKYLTSLKPNGGLPSQNGALSGEDIKKLQRISKAKSNVSLRKIFQTAILGLCETHIYRLWNSQESYMLPKQMRTYFPSLHIDNASRFSDEVWQHHYLHDSTVTEREEMHNEGLACKVFLDKARKWESEWRISRRKNGEEDDKELFETSFASKFPGPNEETLLKNIHIFIERVEGNVQTLSEYAQST